jgi:hypothetical protein
MQAAVVGAAGARLRGTLAVVPDFEQDSVDAYTREAFRVVRGGQERAAFLGVSFAAAVTGARVAGSVLEALDRAGVRVTLESRNLVAPALRARHELAEGATLEEARDRAGSYAASLAGFDIRQAENVGLREGVPAGTYWEKVPGPDACEFCLETSPGPRLRGGGYGYLELDTVARHGAGKAPCQCGVNPVTREERSRNE